MKPILGLLVMNMLLASAFVRGQQPIMFDTVRLNPLNSFLVGYSVFESEEKYCVFATGGDGTGDVQNLRTSLFDLEGQFQTERTFEHSRKAYYGAYAPVTRTQSGGFASGVTRFGGGEVIDSLFLYRFNELGDTLGTSYLASDTTALIRKCIQSSSGDFLLVGFYELPSDAFLCRTTDEGTLISFTALDDVPTFFAMSIAEDADQNLFICGYGQSFEENNSNNANLIKCAPDGTTIWRRTKPGVSWYKHVIVTPDGGVVATGFYRVGGNGVPVAFAVKYDADGNEEWSRDLAQADLEARPCSINDGFLLPDGSIALCGTIRNTTIPGLWDNGMLHKLDPDGNILWSRYYAHYTNLPAGFEHIFNAVQPTSDGGYILTGEAQGQAPPNSSRLWLVKLDSMGCLVPGCHAVGVEEFETQLQSAFVVSPNPASEQVTIELALPEGYRLDGAVRASLVDAQGKEVLQLPMSTNTMHLRGIVDVQSLPSGLYYVHLRDASKWLAGGKVVVE